MGEYVPDKGKITPQMIEAGVEALALHCPVDRAFPVGMEEIAVEAVISAALRASRSGYEKLIEGCEGSRSALEPPSQ